MVLPTTASLSFLLLLLLLLCADSSLMYTQEQVDQISSRYERVIDNLQADVQAEGSLHLPPSLHMIRGVLSITGNRHVRVPPEVIPKGDWSAAFWLRIITLSDDHITSDSSDVLLQTLLYKGNGNDSYTPTWYLEVARGPTGLAVHRVVSRVNANTIADRYIDTGVVTLDKWQLYVFTFSNTSTDSDITYTATLYIDSVLRMEVDYKSPLIVQANEEALLLFQSGHNERGAARALARDVVIFDGALSSAQVGRLYTIGSSRAFSKRDVVAANAALDAVSGSSSSDDGGLSALVATDGYTYEAPRGSGRNAGREDPASYAPLEAAYLSSTSCASVDIRVELYASAAARGSSEALRAWAMLKLFGYEGGEESLMCGMQFGSGRSAAIKGHSVFGAFWGYSGRGGDDAMTPVLALFSAAEGGAMSALVPISSFIAAGVLSAEVLSSINTRYGELAAHVPLPAGSTGQPPAILVRTLRSLSSGTTSKDTMSLGLLFVAAAYDATDAFTMLADRYHRGDALAGISRDVETALYYAKEAAIVSHAMYNKVGAQPLVESDLLDDDTELTVARGNSGNDDELILTQRVHADEGDVPSMLRTADLLYFGGRGLPRDQPAALHYYRQAAAAGDPQGMCGAAAMLLKGEGGPKNTSAAADLYTSAVGLGSVKAMNGLGYLHFNGDIDGMPANRTRAFILFMLAAESQRDADSLLNAGQCLHWGLGTERNVSRAIELYFQSARLFGNFNAIFSLALLHSDGEQGVLARNPGDALEFYMTCARAGPSSLWTRRGLDQYLLGQHSRALSCYLLYGSVYSISARNAEFLLRRRRAVLLAPRSTSLFASPSLLLATHTAVLLSLASKGDGTALLHLGTAYYKGEGILRNVQTATAYYSQAAGKGNPIAMTYLGMMHQFGLGGLPKSHDRADALYAQAQQALLVGSLSSGKQLRPVVTALQALLGGGVAAYAARPLVAMVMRQLWDEW